MMESIGEEAFNFQDERFTDIQMLRYRLPDFESLAIRQKQLIYCLSEVTLFGRDMTFNQFGKYNLRIRKTLEAVYLNFNDDRLEHNFRALEEYLERIRFASGVYHHYACDKFSPLFSEDFFRSEVLAIDSKLLPLNSGESVTSSLSELCSVIFDPTILPKRVDKSDSKDIVRSSACNCHDGVYRHEVEEFYTKLKKDGPTNETPSYGLNSTLIKEGDSIREDVWKIDGKYGAAIEKIVYWLNRAKDFVENAQRLYVINLLIRYYETGDLHDFGIYSIEWLREQEGRIDSINGFIEVYGDPMGLKGFWEGIVKYKDLEATHRTQAISANTQWFEDHSPADPQFHKAIVKDVTANVICAAVLGGGEYPASAIGINLPNADWIRAEHGSKSVAISNLTRAYGMAAKDNGFREEFVIDADTYKLLDLHAGRTDNLHTDLHKCLGHGSGRLLLGTDPDALKDCGSTIEEARADLFGLYYIADQNFLELGLLDSKEAYRAQYYSYMMNGLLTQQVRIKPGKQIEESHMQNRALIAQWAMKLDKENNVVELITCADRVTSESKAYVRINDYDALRNIFAYQLAEIRRIKNKGDFEAARMLVEKYAINLDPVLHAEVLRRYEALNIAPYKGFINPILKPVYNEFGEMVDVVVDYSEPCTEQTLRYSRYYQTL